MSRQPTPLAGRWSVQLLGGLHARNGQHTVDVKHRAVGALLARLALFPGRDHAREELIDLLWPDAPAPSAKNLFRNALSTLGALLATPDIPKGTLLATNRRCVRLNADLIDCDARVFEALVQQGRHAEAVALYRGDLLPGWYDPWIREQRDRLADLFEEATAALRAQPDEPAEKRPAAAPPAARAATTSAAPAPAPLLPGAQRHLPTYATSFFGRQSELDQLADTMARHRLVSLVGPAGSGKTRLSLEFAAHATGFDRVAFVPLAVCRAAAAAHESVREALGLEPAPTPALEQIAAALDATPALLVLDNLEQMLPHGRADWIAELLDRVPSARLLVTSQRAIEEPAGLQIAIAPLPLPQPDAGLADARRNPALALFVARAQAARADFRLHAGNVEVVAALCSALDGLPLAIELAASRIRQLSPQTMLEQLRQGGGMPAANRRHGHRREQRQGRHASLDDALDWSWGLLNARQQAALVVFSEFRSAFDEGAACAVIAARPAAGRALLAALVRRSMLNGVPSADVAPRFGMLRTVRDFLGRRAPESLRREARRRHRQHFLARALACAGGGAGASDGQPGTDADRPDFLHAIAGALDDGEAGTAATIALALRSHWVRRGAPGDVIDLLQATAAHPGQKPLVLCELLCMLAALLIDAGRSDDAGRCAEQAIAVAAAADPPAPRHALDARITAAQVRWRAQRDSAEGLPVAQDLWQRALALADPRLIARAAMLLGAITLNHLGDVEAAADLFARAEAAFAGLGDPVAALSALPGRVACLLKQQRYADVIDMARQGVASARRLHDVQTELLLLNRQGEAQTGLHHDAEALQCAHEQARLAHRHALAYHFAYAIWNQCEPLAKLGRHEDAARLMAYSSRYWTTQFGPIAAGDRKYIEHVRRRVRRALGAARCRALWAEGQALTLKDAVVLGCG